MESPNLEFEYGDTDALTAELSGTAKTWKRNRDLLRIRFLMFLPSWNLLDSGILCFLRIFPNISAGVRL